MGQQKVFWQSLARAGPQIMAELNLTRACKAALIAWTLGVASFVAAFLLPTSNPDLVANTVLFCAVPLVATVGARYYYNQAAAKGVVLGLFMFGVAGSLDAVITVPLLIMPAGGSYRPSTVTPASGSSESSTSPRSPCIRTARNLVTRPSRTRRVPLPRRPSNLCTYFTLVH